jgi:hypothetical protein
MMALLRPPWIPAMLLRNCVTAARGLVVLGPFACALFCGTPASAEMKSFRDWIAACDNTRTCNAYGFDAELAGNAYLRLERSGAADAPLRIVVAVQDGAKLKLTFDDANLGGLPPDPVEAKPSNDDDTKRVVLSDPQSVEAATAGLRKAKKLIVTRIDPAGATPSEPVKSEISLSGLAAALLWMDEQQKRVGTVTALIGRGDKPAAAVPAPPALPAVVAARLPTGPAPKKAPAAVVAKARAVCEDKKLNEAEDTTRLGADEVMYWFQCTKLSGAYNFFYALLIDAPGKPVRVAELKPPPELAARGNGLDTNINPGFDEETHTLSMFNKGRGIGDCGSTSEWVWDGRAFRMVGAKSMPECHGVAEADWAPLYRAERK